ncbi:MAG: PilZ domain-containing protein [Candidatus Omnitrophica bacterium]|nr:PilZ domain-containing protein [Candidatus Omnitrophota bacterium]
MRDGADRRRFARTKYPCLIKLHKKNKPALWGILTHTDNISPVGVRVILRKKIKVTTEVDLKIDLMDTKSALTSKGKVTWVKEILPAQKGQPLRYDTGINFIHIKGGDGQRIQDIVEMHRGFKI